MQPHDIHIRQYGNPESILHKSCDNFNLFRSTHRLYLNSFFCKNLLLQSTETAGLGKHDLWVSGCLFQTDPFSIFKRMPLRNHYRDIRIPNRIIFDFIRFQKIRTEADIIFSIQKSFCDLRCHPVVNDKRKCCPKLFQHMWNRPRCQRIHTADPHRFLLRPKSCRPLFQTKIRSQNFIHILHQFFAVAAEAHIPPFLLKKRDPILFF